jgi:hypothetical protein
MGKETRYVTKLFKNYNVDIAWHPYNRCGIYKLICQCGGAYVGLTGRKFRTRYKEHVRDIRSNKEKTGYSHHILSIGHVYGTLEDTLKIVKIQRRAHI